MVVVGYRKGKALIFALGNGRWGKAIEENTGGAGEAEHLLRCENNCGLLWHYFRIGLFISKIVNYKLALIV